MGKPTIYIGENKGADQLRGSREADQRLCFRYSDSTIPLLQNFKLLALFCDCTGRFVSDLFGNHIVGFPTRDGSFCIPTCKYYSRIGSISVLVCDWFVGVEVRDIDDKAE